MSTRLTRFMPPDSSTESILKRKSFSSVPLLTKNSVLHAPLGDYVVKGLIARGGMGWVHSAKNTPHKTKVAIKTPLCLEQKSFEKFREEAQIAKSMSHPNIVRTFELGEYNEIPFMVMEHLGGRNLKKSLPGNNLMPWRQACKLVAAACIGLDEIHNQGIIHEDIKSSNIAIVSNGSLEETAKIFDFGLARKKERAYNSKGIAYGTAAYMAPEKLRPSSAPYDHRADIYSLGITLFEILAGRHPFVNNYNYTNEILGMHAVRSPPSFREFNAGTDIPDKIEAATMRALSKNPEDRFGTAMEMAAALTSA